MCRSTFLQRRVERLREGVGRNERAECGLRLRFQSKRRPAKTKRNQNFIHRGSSLMGSRKAIIILLTAVECDYISY